MTPEDVLDFCFPLGLDESLERHMAFWNWLMRGGTDEGPMPVEYLFMGLLGCTHVIANKLAKDNGVEFTTMDIDISVTMDSHGTRLISPVQIPFPEVILDINVVYEGPREGAIAVTEKLKHHCAVSKMLQESGTRVIENWVLNGETVTTN